MSNNVNALVMHPDPESVETGADARALSRGAELPPFTQTTSMALGFMQGSPVIIPGDLAVDFAASCQRNPKPCPQVASSNPGDPSLPTFGAEIDVRTDIGGYRIWRHGELVDEVTDIRDLWRDDFVTFVIGCSYSFEDALLADGLELRHVTQGVCVPMYMSNIPLVPSGPFSGHMGVSMRPFRAVDAIRAVELTSRFPMTHGTPVHIGDPGLIGIVDINDPLVGDPVDVRDDELQCFGGAALTPQYSLLQARPEIAITHKPGCLLIGDVPSRGDAMAMPTLAA
jgi:uncharacterized protein YcsI (UPF0317 family)